MIILLHIHYLSLFRRFSNCGFVTLVVFFLATLTLLS